MYLSKWLERVLASGKMGGEDQDDQEGELMSEQELELELELTEQVERQEEEITKHWAVKAATSIALLFKVGSIAFAILSVLALTYLGIMISWGLAFGLPWILAYFYFIWICPAHQLSMGIRKCKPHRMMWWLASTFLHIVPITVILTSYAILPKSLIDQEEANHERIVLTLSLILAILTFFEITVIYATFIVQRERKRRENQEAEQSSTAIYNPRSTINSPPPSYSEVNSELPPNYEDVVKEDKMVNNIPL